tara:strand:- start:3776 stop:4285 length:510 start_codon:yes stop_codon:yes gene_type:complete
MSNQQIENLEVCYKTANMLKAQFPNEVMKIEKNTIIEYSKKNSRLLRSDHDRGNMSGCYAYFTRAKPHRIVVRQKTLKEGKLYSTYGGSHSLAIVPRYKKYVDLYRHTVHGGSRARILIHGNWAFVELICHELAHHRTKGHAKGFKVKYHRFLNHMTNKVLSGEFYNES